MKTIISNLMMKDFERGNGTTAKELAQHIGEEAVFDDKIIKVSKQRFKEIISAFIKIKNEEYNSKLKERSIIKEKIFTENYEVYLANRLANELTIEALEHGRFKINNEPDLRKKAESAKKDFMFYLIEIGSDYAGVLSDIKVDEDDEKLITITQFLNSKKENIVSDFKYGKIIHKDRLNRIFSYIKKKTKERYDSFKKENIKRMKDDKPLLSLGEIINIIIKNTNERTAQYKSLRDYINSLKNNLKDAADQRHTLTQKHEYYHQKSSIKIIPK